MHDDPRWKLVKPTMRQFSLYDVRFQQCSPGICFWKATVPASRKVYQLRYEDGRWSASLKINGTLVCYTLPPSPDTAQEALHRILAWERGEAVQGVAKPVHREQ